MHRNLGWLTALALMAGIVTAAGEAPKHKIHGNGTVAKDSWSGGPGVEPRRDAPIVPPFVARPDGRARDQAPGPDQRKRMPMVGSGIRADGGGADDMNGVDPFHDGFEGGKAICFGDGTGSPCPLDNKGTHGHGCDNAAMTGGALLVGRGAPHVSMDTMTLEVDGLPFDTMAFFLVGRGLARDGYGTPFGNGIGCLSGAVTQFGARSVSYGYARYPEVGDPPLGLVQEVSMRGGNRFYQVMYRDHRIIGTGTTFNLSNGWLVPWEP